MHVVSHLLVHSSSHSHWLKFFAPCHIHPHAKHGCLSLTRPTPLSTSQPSSCLSSSSLFSISATNSSRSSTRRSWKTCATPPTTGVRTTYDVLYLPTHTRTVQDGRKTSRSQEIDVNSFFSRRDCLFREIGATRCRNESNPNTFI